MKPNLQIDAVSLVEGGPALTLSLGPGRSMGVFGPAGSGKSFLTRAIAGLEKPKSGSIRAESVYFADRPSAFSGKASPEEIVRKVVTSKSASKAAEALTATRLWDVRKRSLSSLSEGQAFAAALLPILVTDARTLVLDHGLDSLDPWTFASVVDALGKRLLDGRSLVYSSNRPELAVRADAIVILNDRKVVFAGSFDDLASRKSQDVVEVETQNQLGVRSLVAPFEIRFTEIPGGARIEAAEGQKIAAKLLIEGYGDVKSVVVKRPSAAELLHDLIR